MRNAKSSQEYVGRIQGKSSKNKTEDTKKYSLPHPQPNQSIKSTKCEYPSSIYILTHTKKLLRKIFFCHWSNNSSQSKYLPFLSFQIVKKIQDGAVVQALICLLSTKESCQPMRVSLTDSIITHWILKIKNTSYHKSLALSQWRRIWSMDSGFSLHKTHLFRKELLHDTHLPII